MFFSLQTVRSIFKQKTFSGINVFGMALGFTSFILVSLFVEYEFNWDRNNEKFDRIYRVQRFYSKDKTSLDHNNISPHTLGITRKLISGKCPEVENIVVLKEMKDVQFSGDKNAIESEKAGFFADNTIFSIFSFHFTQGNGKSALKEPQSIILSETLARKLFPKGNALGKTIIADIKYPLTITGIYKDLPKNSILFTNFLVSMSTIEKQEEVHTNKMGWYMTYLLLRDNKDFKKVSEKIYHLFESYGEPLANEKIFLCPLSKVFLNFNGNNDYTNILYVFYILGILILIISAINYINLTTANANTRVKEIAIRKISGSSQFQIVYQHIVESLIFSFIALTISIVLVELMLPYFNSITNKELSLLTIKNGWFLSKISFVTLIIGLISGIYPGMYLVRLNIAYLLKYNIAFISSFFSFRKFLVCFQLTSSVFLITIALYAVFQIQYILNKNLGFDKENVVYTKLTSSNNNGTFDELRQRILQNPEITNTCMSKHLPFVSFGGGVTNWEGGKPDEIVNIRDNTISHDFFETLKIPIIKGRNFLRDSVFDYKNKCIINETAWKVFKWNEPVGKHIDGNKWEVIGVVKDFHYKDMYNTIEPAIFRLHNGNLYGTWSFAFRIKPGKSNKAKEILTREFKGFFPHDPFEFQPLETPFKNENVIIVYQSLKNTLVFFSVIHIFLAIIGLIGLVNFITNRKTKEIGIRKINGASSVSIFLMLIKEFIVLMAIASFIAWTCALILGKHIPGAYKIEMEWWILILSSLIVLAITIMVIFYKTLKAAYSNPVKALRYE